MSILGDMLGEATGALKAAGYNVDVERQVSSQPTGTVLDVHPDVGDPLVPGRTVTVHSSEGRRRRRSLHPVSSVVQRERASTPTRATTTALVEHGDSPNYTGFVQVVRRSGCLRARFGRRRLGLRVLRTARGPERPAGMGPEVVRRTIAHGGGTDE